MFRFLWNKLSKKNMHLVNVGSINQFVYVFIQLYSFVLEPHQDSSHSLINLIHSCALCLEACQESHIEHASCISGRSPFSSVLDVTCPRQDQLCRFPRPMKLPLPF